MVNSEFSTKLGGKLDYSWREAFQQACHKDTADKLSFARVAGKDTIHVLASLSVVMARGIRQTSVDNADMLVEPLNSHLPGGLVIVPVLLSSQTMMFLVQVVNFSGRFLA